MDKKTQKLLAQVRETFGIELELPLETPSDLMRQAQAVLDYYHTKGADFKERTCKGCGNLFAYRWDSSGIAYCSIPCIARSLEEIGLSWDTKKPPSERWGKTIPAVVPPDALRILQAKDDLPEVQHCNTSSE
jgi:hypothetical protein